MPSTRATSTFAAALAALVSPLVAQLPPNHVAVGTTPYKTGTSGLFYVSLATGQTTRVSGLPAKFTVATGNGGVWSVVRRSDDKLVLGTGATGGKPVSMTMLTLAGSMVVGKKNLVVGTVPTGWSFGLGGNSLMPDGKRVLVATPSVIWGPMNGHRLGIADFEPATPTITPIRLQGTMLGTFVYTTLVSRDGRSAFVITGMGNQDARPFRLYQVDLTTGALALLHTENQGFLWSLGLRAHNELVTTVTDNYAAATPKPTEFLTFQITGFGQATMTRVVAKQVEGVYGDVMDPVSGQMLMSSWDFVNSATPNEGSIFLGDPRSGDLKVLTTPPAGGWGGVQCFAMHSSLDFYKSTPQSHEVGFAAFPNAGGAPKAGNLTFSVTLQTSVTTNNASGLMLMGVRPLDVPLVGTQLLVDPVLIAPLTVPTPGQPVPFALPIPPTVPAGTSIYMQWALCESGLCRGSRGLKITTR